MRISLITNLSGKAASSLLIIMMALLNRGIAQASYQSVNDVKIKIEGTSNIHDWEMNGNKGSSTAVFDFDANGALTGLSSLSFSIPVENLKSEHTTMDNNAYKAMRAGKYTIITYTASSATIKANGSGSYTIYTRGKLTISGVTRDAEVTASCIVNPADKSITTTGAYTLKMTSYSVTPPSIMFGAIKTGDDITVKFNFIYKKA